MKVRILGLVVALLGFWTAVAYAGPAPMVPVAVCNDGMTMKGTNPHEHRGACSGHGGVAKWADGSPVKSHAPKTSYSK